MLRFREYISEWLNDDQRYMVNSWLRKQQGDSYSSGSIHSPAAEAISGHVFSGDGHVIPAVAHVMRGVIGHLDRHGYRDHDYVAGTTVDGHGRVVSMGKALERSGASRGMVNDYASDDRRGAIDLEHHDIVISRHPYHVAEASTNKKWKSCAGLTAKGRPCRMGGGLAARKLPAEIAAGTHVAYLVPRGGDDGLSLQDRIDRAVGRVYLKPHIGESSGHVVLSPENVVYGVGSGKNLGMLRTLERYSRENYPMLPGEMYKKHGGVYDDDKSRGVSKFNVGDESIKMLRDHSDPRVRGQLLGSRDLSSRNLHGLIDYYGKEAIGGDRYSRDEMHDRLGMLAIHPNLDKGHIDKLLGMGVERVDGALSGRKNLGRGHVVELLRRGGGGMLGISNNSAIKLHPSQIHDMISHGLSNEGSGDEVSRYLLKSIAGGRAKELDRSHVNRLLESGNSDVLGHVMEHHDLDDEQKGKLLAKNDAGVDYALSGHGLNSGHIDELIRRHNNHGHPKSNLIMRSLASNSKNSYNSGQLHSIIDHVESMKHGDKDMRHLFGGDEKDNALRNLASRKDLDSGHIDRLLNHSQTHIKLSGNGVLQPHHIHQLIDHALGDEEGKGNLDLYRSHGTKILQNLAQRRDLDRGHIDKMVKSRSSQAMDELALSRSSSIGSDHLREMVRNSGSNFARRILNDRGEHA